LEAAGGQPGPAKLTGATIMSAQTYSQTELTGAATYSFPVVILEAASQALTAPERFSPGPSFQQPP